MKYCQSCTHYDSSAFRRRLKRYRAPAYQWRIEKKPALVVRAVEPAGELADVKRIGRKL